MNAASDDRENDPGSAKQISWIEIANQVRLKLEQRLLGISDMTIAECLELVKALREALYLETAAMTFDNTAEKQNEQWQ